MQTTMMKGLEVAITNIRSRNAISIYMRRSVGTTTTTPNGGCASSLNCARALIKAHEGDAFGDLLQCDVTTLQGIGPKHQEQLHSLRLKTIDDLANYKFFHLAKAISVLAETEQDDSRLAEARLNINKGLDKAFEKQSFREIVNAPVSALQGVSDKAGETWAHMGVRTVGDLARFKYCAWAHAMQTAAKYEQNTIDEP